MAPPNGSASGLDRLVQVERLCREGRLHARAGERDQALTAFLAAWDLLPEPKDGWDTSTFILASVGDLLRSDRDGSLDALVRARGRTAAARDASADAG